MAMTVTISTYRYRQIYGAPPSGFRLWYFLMPGGRTFRHNGEFDEAVRVAIAHASRLPLGSETIVQVFA